MKTFNEFVNNKEVTVICVGDIYPGRNVESKAYFGYGYPFAKIGDHLTCDVLMGNLEGVVDDIYGTQIRLKTTPRLSMSKSWLPELKKVGFSIVNVANNHFNDYGNEGAVNTIKELADNGIVAVGGEHQIWIHEQNGIDIGFLGCIDDEMFSKKHEGLMKTSKIESEIHELKMDCDHVIVNIHMGTEYADKANQKQMDLAYRCIDAGAAAVIMHHAHVIQEIEHYNGGFIAYGLGNFIFDQCETDEVKTGLSIKLTFSKSELTKVQKSIHTVDNFIINPQAWLAA